MLTSSSPLIPPSLVPLTTQPGDGQNFPKQGDRVHIHYVGTLESKTGREFDSSRKRQSVSVYCTSVSSLLDRVLKAFLGFGFTILNSRTFPAFVLLTFI